ncbi:MAG: cytidylate kinase family protein [Bryobacteraceae bacterium]
MAFLTVSGEPGCRVEEVARVCALRLRFELITESRLRELITGEFGSEVSIPEKAWPAVVTSILAQLGKEQPLAVCVPGSEFLFQEIPGTFRLHLVAGEARRTGLLMLEHRLERPAAKQLMKQLERQVRDTRKAHFGKSAVAPSAYDLVVNMEQFDAEQVAVIVEQAATIRGLLVDPLLSAAAEAQIQFQTRLRLAKFGITPPDKVTLKKKVFANHSEQIFANLLDFYRIPWEYEPKSFPIQWDKDGRVLEAFTPDFYLPEFDLYVELTTMKQSLVTKKNRKVKLLKTLYPHVNVQVFYQKDFRNLIFKYGLAERGVMV